MKRNLLSAAILSLAVSTTAHAAPTVEELYDLVKKQQAEIDRLKVEVGETDAKVEATADAVEKSAGTTSKAASWASKTQIGGYGEHHYNNFEKSDDKIDAHRFVLYIGHTFSDSVRFFSEFELEHGLVKDGGPGEVELEQAFIEWDYMDGHSVIAGQFLIPVGILNETHEPDTYYGVERNLIEKNIIPTTWWETGVMFTGELAPGLNYDFAVHSGLKADDGGKIRGGRQKSANAVANDFAYTGRLKYTAVPGLELAATYQLQSNITQGVAADDTSASLFEAHAIYSINRFTVRGLYVDWNIDGETFDAAGRDSQTGWYVEPSVKVTDNLGVFIRYSEWDNEAGLAGATADTTLDYGANFWLTDTVVFKLDFQKQDMSDGADNDSLNLGIGWSF